jgi:hypothetical protein
MISLPNQIASGKTQSFDPRLIRAYWVVVTRRDLGHSIPILIRRRVAPRPKVTERGRQ